MLKLIFMTLLYTTAASAQSPTIVYGASENADGKPDAYLVVQPQNAPNPLGDPIPDYLPDNPAEAPAVTPVQKNSAQPGTADTPAPLRIIDQKNTQDPAPFSETPQQMQDQIENTLYEGGDRIYDVQSYPLKDIKTITEPNVDPTITTYPEY